MLGLWNRYWKILMFLPLVVLAASFAILINNTLATGYFMDRDVEMTGGKILTFVVESADVQKIDSLLPEAIIHMTQGAANNLLVEVAFDADEERIKDVVNGNAVVVGEPTIKSIGPAMGAVFLGQAQTAIIFAFIAMGIFVFILFRSLVPSSIVVLAGISDIVITIAILDIIGIRLSLAVLAALLMVIGYSVDTNILLTSNLLRGGAYEIPARIKNALKTSLTMNATTMVALFSVYMISGSFILQQIATVLMIAIAIDVPATWLSNAGLLRLWLTRKKI